MPFRQPPAETPSIELVFQAGIESVLRTAWPHLSAQDKALGKTNVSFPVGTPVTPGSGESVDAARSTIADTALKQIEVSRRGVTVARARSVLLSKALEGLTKDFEKSSMLKSASTSGRSASGATKGDNRVLKHQRLAPNWHQELPKQRVSDTRDAAEYLMEQGTVGLLDSCVLVSALCATAKSFPAHYQEAVNAVLALLRKAQSVDPDLLGPMLLTASQLSPRPQDCRKLIEAVQVVSNSLSCQTNAACKQVSVADVWCLDMVTLAESSWSEELNVLHANTVTIACDQIEGDVLPVTRIDACGRVSQETLSCEHAVTCTGGKVFFRGGASSRVRLTAECETLLEVNCDPIDEVRECAGLLLSSLATHLTSQKLPSSRLSTNIAPLLTGGAREPSDPSNSDAVDSVMKAVRCKASAKKAVRAFVAAVLHAAGTSAAVNEISTRATLHSDVIGQFKGTEIAVLEHYVGGFNSPSPVLPSTEACDAVLHHLSKCSAEVLRTAIKECSAIAAKMTIVASAISTAACLLVPSTLPIACAPLLQLLADPSLWDRMIGCNAITASSARAALSQIVTELLQHAIDSDDVAANQRPHHMLTRRTPELGFALTVLAVVSSPAAIGLTGLNTVPEALLRLFSLPQDMTRSESYRFDSEDWATPAAAENAQADLEKALEGACLIDNTANGFSRNGGLTMKGDPVAVAQRRWCFTEARASTKAFRVDITRSDPTPLCVGVVRAARRAQFSSTDIIPENGCAVLRTDSTIFSCHDEPGSCWVPVSVGKCLHVVVRPQSEAIGTVAFFSEGELVCQTTVDTSEPLVPVIIGTKGSAWEMKTSFGDVAGVNLDVIDGGQPAPYPTRRATTIAASRTLYALSHSRSPEVVTSVVESIVTHGKSLLSVLNSSTAADCSSSSIEAASKQNLVRWVANAAALGHLACLRQVFREISSRVKLISAVLDLLQGYATAGRECTRSLELRCCAMLLMRDVVNETHACDWSCDPEFLDSLFSRGAELSASKEGGIQYSPQWVAKNASPKLSCDGASLSFGDQTAEHLAAFAAPALPRDGAQSAASISVVRAGVASMPYTFVGVGDLRSISPKLVNDYAPFLKDPKKHLYVVPSRPEDMRMIASINAEELKRNRENWASPNAIFCGGDTITASINYSKRTVAFTRNGRALGTLFSNLPLDVDLSPFVALFKSDTSVLAGSVATATMPAPSTVLSLALLQALRRHPSLSAPVAARVDREAKRGDMAALRVLGCDGEALAAKLMPSGRPVSILGVRISPLGVAEVACRAEDSAHVQWVSWSSCAPQYGVAAVQSAPPELVPHLVASVAALVRSTTDGLAVQHPGRAARILRLLASSRMDKLSDAQLAVLASCTSNFAGTKCPAMTEADTVDRAWGDPAALTAELLVPRGALAPHAPLAARREDALCSRCHRSWTTGDCDDGLQHFVPLVIGQQPGDEVMVPASWKSPTWKLSATLRSCDTAVSGKGESAVGSFTCSGWLVAGTKLSTRLTFAHSERKASSSPTTEGTAEWACEVCTFLNPQDSSRCGMCTSARTGANWVCAVCTYAFNANELASCSMCGTRRRTEEAGGPRAAVSAAVGVECAACSRERDVQNVLDLLKGSPCESCGESTWTLCAPVVATFEGDLSADGSSIQGKLCIRGHADACNFSRDPAIVSTDSSFRPVGFPAATNPASAVRGTDVKPPSIIVGAALFAKKILLSLPDKYVSDEARCDSVRSVARPEVQAQFLRGLPDDTFNQIAEIATARINVMEPADPSLMGYMSLLGSICVSGHPIEPATVNRALYAVAAVSSGSCTEEVRRCGVSAIAKLLESSTRARGEAVVRLANHRGVVSTNPALCVLQSLRGSVLPTFDPVFAAAGAVLATVDRMVRRQRLPELLERDLSEQLCHWVSLPQTTTTAAGHLIAGQIHGSVAARRSRKDRVYYEVEAPRNLRAAEIRMGWGTSTHGRNGATYHVGSDSHSWAYNLKNLVVCFGGENEYTPPFFVKEGDVIGSALDLESGKCWWSINGFEMQPIQVDGLLEDDEVFPYVSAALRPDNALHVSLTDTKFLPEGFVEFENYLKRCTLKDGSNSDYETRDLPFYMALNGLLDEVCAGGTSVGRLRKFVDSADDNGLEAELEAVLPAHQNVESAVDGSVRRLKPYIRHLLTLSDLSHSASKAAHIVKDSTLLTSLLQHVRYLTVLPARWVMLERVLEGRVVRSLANTMKVTIDRAAANSAYTAPNDTEASRTVLGQLFTQTNAKDVFLNLRMFTVAMAGEIAEDGGGLFRSVMSMIADEIMGREIADGASPAGDGDSEPNQRSPTQRRTRLFEKNEHSTFFNAVPNVKATSDEDLAMFQWFGKLVGNLVCTGSAVLAVTFPRLVWKLLVGEEISFDQYLHDCNDSVRGAVGSDDFLLDDELLFDTIPGVRKFLPTTEAASLPERAQARKHAAQQALIHSFDVQLHAMRDGFCSVVPREAVTEMTWADLQRRVCGASTFTADELLHWFDTALLDPPSVDMLADVLRSMSSEQRNKLLLFCSGQTRLPLPEKVKVTCGDEPDKYPTAHTCSPITLTMQPYADAVVAKKMFLVSMAHAYEYAFV